MRLSLPSLPGPADVLGGAAAVRDGLVTAVDLVPRAAAAMTRVEGLLDRADALVARAEGLATRADAAVTLVETVASSADLAVARSAHSLEVAEITVRDAGRAAEAVSGLLSRLDTIMSTWEKPLRKLAPAAEKLADSLDPAEVQAVISIIDRMPVVLDYLENDVLPMMRQLDRVGPDVHELLEVVEDLRRVITGLPGVGLLRRRGETEPPEIEGSVHDEGEPANGAPRRR
jgi:hypothetical protein